MEARGVGGEIKEENKEEEENEKEKLKRKRRRRRKSRRRRRRRNRRKLKSSIFVYKFYQQAGGFRIIRTLNFPYITNLRTVAMF